MEFKFKLQTSKFKPQKGFTLIEFIVVVAIIISLSSLSFLNYRAGEKEITLQRSIYRLAQNIRRAQELAMSSREFEKKATGGYGLYFNLSPAAPDSTHYILFADINNDKQFGAGDGIVETIELEKGIEITNLSSGQILTIVFSPPDPTVTINPLSSSATITLGALSKTRTVTINTTGQIDID